MLFNVITTVFNTMLEGFALFLPSYSTMPLPTEVYDGLVNVWGAIDVIRQLPILRVFVDFFFDTIIFLMLAYIALSVIVSIARFIPGVPDFSVFRR